MRIILKQEECFCSLCDFYEHVAKKLGIVVTDNAQFDCRKICVSKAVQDELWVFYYQEAGLSNIEIAALFLNAGPKANIAGGEEYIAEVGNGFVTR